MSENESLLDKARELAEARNHKLLPFVRQGRSSGTRCVTFARQVYVMPDPGSNGAAIGGDAIAEVCIRKPSGSGPAREPLRSCSQALSCFLSEFLSPQFSLDYFSPASAAASAPSFGEFPVSFCT
jgi:hypothetical protein